MRILRCVVMLSAVMGVIAPAFAQVDTAAAQKKLLSKRAAEADAYRKLAECIKGLQITSDTYVKDFVAESDQIKAAMDTFIKAVRLGEPKWFDDMSCEVPAEVTVASVIRTLEQAYTAHYHGHKIKSTDIQHIKETVKKDVIKVIGMGAPREDLPPDLPVGAVEQLKGPPIPPRPSIPDLWRRIGPQGRMKAEQAAETDAKRKLVERILGLRVTSDTLVKDFVAESDQVKTATSGTLIGHTKVRTYFHDDEPICEVTMEVPVESVIKTIDELHTRSIHGDHVKGTDVVKVKESIKTDKFQATGMGIPPQQFLARYNAALPAGQQMPEWASQAIRMTGNGVAPADKAGTPQGKLLAARAAELDAKRKLGEHINGLTIRSDTSVKDFVAEHDDIQAQMQAVLVGSSVEKTTFTEDATAEVTVSVPGMQVWEVISTYQRVAVPPPPPAPGG
jgi:hypothetical protein